MWTYEVKNKLIAHGGSIQNISEIPEELKELYKTVWEIPQKHILDRAIARSPFIDQSQSLNIHMKEPTYSKLCSMHFYAWKGGLKTGKKFMINAKSLIIIRNVLSKDKTCCRRN